MYICFPLWLGLASDNLVLQDYNDCNCMAKLKVKPGGKAETTQQRLTA